MGFHLYEQAVVGFGQSDRIGLETGGQCLDGGDQSRGRVAACGGGGRIAHGNGKKRLVVVAMDGKRDLVDGNHLDHAATAGDRPEGMPVAAAGEREPVCVGVGVAHIDRLDPHFGAGRAKGRDRFREPRVVGFPAEEAAEEPHVGALRVVRRRQ